MSDENKGLSLQQVKSEIYLWGLRKEYHGGHFDIEVTDDKFVIHHHRRD